MISSSRDDDEEVDGDDDKDGDDDALVVPVDSNNCQGYCFVWAVFINTSHVGIVSFMSQFVCRGIHCWRRHKSHHPSELDLTLFVFRVTFLLA